MFDEVKITVLPGGRVNRRNAAMALGLAPKTLAEWARTGQGPRAFKVGGRVFYALDDVLAYRG